MSALAEGRAPYLTSSWPHVTRASASLQADGEGGSFAVVDLGQVGQMHVHAAAQAREIAAAFTAAAALLDQAEGMHAEGSQR